MPKLTDDPRTPDEILEDEARALKEVPPEVNPAAVDWPAEVKTERIDHGDPPASEDDGSTHDHHEGD